MKNLESSRVKTVIIAGAGPGDPELISLKALKHLQTAEVILIDRLVAPSLVEEYANNSSQVIYVGKQCSKGIHTPQTEINHLMCTHALAGKKVLRLKGGDVSLFSNILDELKSLKQYNIPYEIIPGISSAFGAAAYAGIPLTARNFSKGVRFLTVYDLENITHSQWIDWVETEDTLVFYMSGQRINQLGYRFFELNITPEKGMAIIQQASTTEQKTRIYQFSDFKNKTLHTFEYVPTLLIIGKVTQLHQKYQWFEEKKQTISYFDQTPFIK